ncbi:hypothetical protein [Hymenobacter latericus]|uniref:hypothetical protein n=1 Tax=Hymenobacter sp. YIM 151858-1 TaxID=2987688 RepID=UPI002225D324|nr:hypothetical protein [Hymenobacter sp. YIM 151858-1]UYZ60059.1 hypothetical protein OIS50_04485 [Hymenobacter sp. YIM 151858-1]
MNQDNDWGTVPSPIGPITVPRFSKVRAMSDEQLCEYMNTQAHVDPAGLAEATQRKTVCHYYDGKQWTWNTADGYQAWKATQPSPFDIILQKLTER